MLTERQRMILNAIVNDYITSAEPIGSRSVSKRGDVGYSPATIRNEMSDLEEMGFLEQPHTSAGRIPSHKGYRYYVDHLIKLQQFTMNELEFAKLFFTEKIYEVEEALQHVATILSGLTQYTAIALGPERINTTLKHLQLIPLQGNSAVAIIVTNTGHVENKTVSIPEGVSGSELEKFVNLLNHKLAGISLLHLRSKLDNEVKVEIGKHIQQYGDLVRIIEDVLSNKREEKVYLSGTTNILNQPEFKDIEKVKSIFDLFDETETLARLFSETAEEGGIQVRIGTENDLEAFNNCSLVTATYSLDGQSLGAIGIIGPTRMEYVKVIHLLDYLSRDLAYLFSRWFK